jgi:hypothetical protein
MSVHAEHRTCHRDAGVCGISSSARKKPKPAFFPSARSQRAGAGEELVEMDDMVRAGRGGFSDDGVSV